MARKTISVRLEAYERLRARRHSGESCSDVVMRARWTEEPVTAGQYLQQVRERGSIYDAAGLDALDELKAEDRPSEDKWIQA